MQKYFTSSQEVNKELHNHLRCTKQRQESKRMFQNHLCQIHTPIRSQEISEIDETKIIPTQLQEAFASCMQSDFRFTEIYKSMSQISSGSFWYKVISKLHMFVADTFP